MSWAELTTTSKPRCSTHLKIKGNCLLKALKFENLKYTLLYWLYRLFQSAVASLVRDVCSTYTKLGGLYVCVCVCVYISTDYIVLLNSPLTIKLKTLTRNYSEIIWKIKMYLYSVLPRIFSRRSGRYVLGRVNNHIKVYMLHPLEDQSELLAEGP